MQEDSQTKTLIRKDQEGYSPHPSWAGNGSVLGPHHVALEVPRPESPLRIHPEASLKTIPPWGSHPFHQRVSHLCDCKRGHPNNFFLLVHNWHRKDIFNHPSRSRGSFRKRRARISCPVPGYRDIHDGFHAVLWSCLGQGGRRLDLVGLCLGFSHQNATSSSASICWELHKPNSNTHFHS